MEGAGTVLLTDETPLPLRALLPVDSPLGPSSEGVGAGEAKTAAGINDLAAFCQEIKMQRLRLRCLQRLYGSAQRKNSLLHWTSFQEE